MKIMLLALCLAVVVAAFGFVWPELGEPFFNGPTPTPQSIRDSVFNGLPRGLQ